MTVSGDTTNWSPRRGVQNTLPELFRAGGRPAIDTSRQPAMRGEPMDTPKPMDCQCLTWGRSPDMQSAKGTKLDVWGTEHHTSCPYHPDNDGKWCGLFAVQPLDTSRQPG